MLLVDAKEDGEFDQVETHAGGITMRGPLMYVAETNDGLSVYDTCDIVASTTTSRTPTATSICCRAAPGTPTWARR